MVLVWEHHLEGSRTDADRSCFGRGLDQTAGAPCGKNKKVLAPASVGILFFCFVPLLIQ